VDHLGHKVAQRRDEWIALARSKALAASGELFEARDELLGFIAAVDDTEYATLDPLFVANDHERHGDPKYGNAMESLFTG